MEETVRLPDPCTAGGKPLMDCLRERRSTRSYSGDDIPLQELSNLLWAAFGLSREYIGTGVGNLGCRTAPGACNLQEIDVYVARADGLFLYEPHTHGLRAVHAEDVRRWTAHPAQPWVADVPMVLIYVADIARVKEVAGWDVGVWPYADAAFIAENVYLYCASSGLATVVRALMDRPALAEAMRLRPEQMITLSQPVGYPG